MFDKFLGALCGAEPGTRVEAVQVCEPDGTPTLELRLLCRAEGLGWQVHRRIRLAPGQVADLRAALNMMDPDAQKAASPRAGERRPSHLRLVADEELTA